jgi:hypothetical protein
LLYCCWLLVPACLDHHQANIYKKRQNAGAYSAKTLIFMGSHLHSLIVFIIITKTADGGTVVKVLRYKPEGRWFDSRRCHWNFSLT